LGRAVELAPDNVEAWLALVATEQDPAQKMACFRRILELDPDNVEARFGLEMLEQDAESGAATEQNTGDELEAVIAEASRQLEEAMGPPPPDEAPLDDAVASRSALAVLFKHRWAIGAKNVWASNRRSISPAVRSITSLVR
jgi:hypothetical protein